MGIWTRYQGEYQPDWAGPEPSDYQKADDMITTWVAGLAVGGNGLFVLLDEPTGQLYSVPRHAWSVAFNGRKSNPVVADATIKRMLASILGGHANISYLVGGEQIEARTASNPDGRASQSKLISVASPLYGTSPLISAAPMFRISLAADATAELHYASGGAPSAVLINRGRYHRPGRWSVH